MPLTIQELVSKVLKETAEDPFIVHIDTLQERIIEQGAVEFLQAHFIFSEYHEKDGNYVFRKRLP